MGAMAQIWIFFQPGWLDATQGGREGWSSCSHFKRSGCCLFLPLPSGAGVLFAEGQGTGQQGRAKGEGKGAGGRGGGSSSLWPWGAANSQHSSGHQDLLLGGWQDPSCARASQSGVRNSSTPIRRDRFPHPQCRKDGVDAESWRNDHPIREQMNSLAYRTQKKAKNSHLPPGKFHPYSLLR